MNDKAEAAVWRQLRPVRAAAVARRLLQTVVDRTDDGRSAFSGRW